MSSEDKPFTMPRPIVGEIVWIWRCDIRQGAFEPAVVLVVNPQSIMARKLRTQGPAEGVRHADDPMLLVGDQRKNGCWDFTPVGKMLRTLESQLCPGALGGAVSLSDSPQQTRIEPKTPPKGSKKPEPAKTDEKAAATA